MTDIKRVKDAVQLAFPDKVVRVQKAIFRLYGPTPDHYEVRILDKEHNV